MPLPKRSFKTEALAFFSSSEGGTNGFCTTAGRCSTYGNTAGGALAVTVVVLTALNGTAYAFDGLSAILIAVVCHGSSPFFRGDILIIDSF